MSDLFISYAREDRATAERLARALEALGWSVFWDATIPTGKTWREVIGTNLTSAKCIIVLWSRTSVTSNWVIEEADHGLRRHILIPIVAEELEPPLGFRSLQTADLSGWDGTVTAPVFQAVVRDVTALAGPPVTNPGPPSASAGGARPDNAARENADAARIPPHARRPSTRMLIAAAVTVGIVAVALYYRPGTPGDGTRSQAAPAAAPASGAGPGNAGVAASPTPGFPQSWMVRVHFINVGQGTATLVEFPHAALLVDAGSDGGTGKTHLLEYLRRFFQTRNDLHNRLDAVVISHPHVDHINALLEVLRNHSVQLFVDNGGPATGAGGSQLSAARSYVATHDIRQLHVDGRATAQAYMLDFPRTEGTIRLLGGARNCSNLNNDSLVVHVTVLNSRVLLPGDADLDDTDCEGLLPYLLSHNSVDHADVLQVPHHGSTSGLSQDFLRRVSPTLAVISAGRVDIAPTTMFDAFNYGHPRASTVEELARAVSGDRATRRVFVMSVAKQPMLLEVSKAVYCTCWDGDVVASMDGTGRAPRVVEF